MLPEFVNLVEERQNGRLSAEAFLKQTEDLLGGLALYPTAPLMALGIAAAGKLDQTPGMAIDVVLKMISSTDREVRAVAAAMIFHLARFQPAFWLDPVKHLIVDDDWEVRDLAAHAFDSQDAGEGAAEFHAAYVQEVVESWVKDPLPQLRRAATQSLLGYASRHPEFRPKLLEILDPLLDDASEYVRDTHLDALRKLGRIAPELVLDYVERSLGRINDNSRETLRAVLNQPFAARHPERRKALLQILNTNSSQTR